MKKITIILISLMFSFGMVSAEMDPAVNLLSEIKNSKDYSFVKKYLADKNDELKIVSIYALVDIDKNLASEDLKKIYMKSSYEVKINIIYVVGEMKLNENIGFLNDRLNVSEKKEINNEAISALLKINNDEVIQPLINHLNKSPKNEFLINSIPGLGVKTIKPLFLNLPDGDENVMFVTRRILNEIINENTFDALTEILKLSVSEIDPIKRLVKEIIEERGKNAIEPAVQLLIKADGKLNDELIRYLSGQKDDEYIVGKLINIWSELQDDQKKIEILDILNNYKINAYAEFLLNNIVNSSDSVRKHILSKMEAKKRSFADIINSKLSETSDENILQCYIDFSIKLGGGNIDALISLLFSAKSSSCAEQILVKLDDKKVDLAIINVLVAKKNMTDFFKDKIRDVLVKRAPLSIETLIKGLKHKDSADECEGILLKIGKQTIPYLIGVLIADENDLQIFKVTEIFLKMGKMTAPYLISELKVDDLWSKMNIAEVLIKFEKIEVVPYLIEILETDDKGLQYKAVFGLRNLGPAAVPELIKNLNTSKEVTLTGVIRALGEIRDKTAESSLKEKLASVHNEKIKAEIEKALKKIGG